MFTLVWYESCWLGLLQPNKMWVKLKDTVWFSMHFKWVLGNRTQDTQPNIVRESQYQLSFIPWCISCCHFHPHTHDTHIRLSTLSKGPTLMLIVDVCEAVWALWLVWSAPYTACCHALSILTPLCYNQHEFNYVSSSEIRPYGWDFWASTACVMESVSFHTESIKDWVCAALAVLSVSRN